VGWLPESVVVGWLSASVDVGELPASVVVDVLAAPLSLPLVVPDPEVSVCAEPLASLVASGTESSVEVGTTEEDVVRFTVGTARPRQPLARLGLW
jgi:hypothetical protein